MIKRMRAYIREKGRLFYEEEITGVVLFDVRIKIKKKV